MKWESFRLLFVRVNKLLKNCRVSGDMRQLHAHVTSLIHTHICILCLKYVYHKYMNRQKMQIGTFKRAYTSLRSISPGQILTKFVVFLCNHSSFYLQKCTWKINFKSRFNCIGAFNDSIIGINRAFPCIISMILTWKTCIPYLKMFSLGSARLSIFNSENISS